MQIPTTIYEGFVLLHKPVQPSSTPTGRGSEPRPPALSMPTPASARTTRLWELYRLTDEDYESILSHQGGVCAITGKIPNKHLNIDHDHKTGLIRGLLSPWANKGLSFFNDDPDYLEAAARYLRNPPAVSAIGPHYGLLGRAIRKKKMIYGGIQ